MQKDILLDRYHAQTRLAVLEDDRLCEYYTEQDECEKLVGNIYLGRVENVLPGMQAAFIDVGLNKNGFLYAGDIQIDDDRLKSKLKGLSINKLVRPGQEILVQVVKETTGSKGARLTNNITLPGRMVVLLPTVGYVGISRRIEDAEEAGRLRALAESIRPEGMGLIVRTAAAGANEADLQNDIAYLTKLWHAIQLRAEHAIAPVLVHRDMGLVHRSVRDMLLPDVERMLVADEDIYAFVKDNARMLSDELAAKVFLHRSDTPLFSLFGIEKQLERALQRRVWLKSGGYCVFDYTEALTVIDVNTGKFVGKQSLSDTIFKINVEAAKEIALQLRLRDIGGIIVIDFIDMEETRHREELLETLRVELKKDRTKTNLVGLTGLGLVEMTRKKNHQPIRATHQETCPMCQGSGLVDSASTIARKALEEAEHLPGASGAWICASEEVVRAIRRIGASEGCVVYAKAIDIKRDQYRIEPLNEAAPDAKARVETSKRSYYL